MGVTSLKIMGCCWGGEGFVIESLLLHTRYLRHWTQDAWAIIHASPDRVWKDPQCLTGLFCSTCSWRVINFEEVLASCRVYDSHGRSQWPHGLRRGSAAARLLRIAGSNPTRSSDVSLLWVLGAVRLEVSASGRSLVQGSHTECEWGDPGPLGGGGCCWAMKKKLIYTDTMQNILIKHLTPFGPLELYLRFE